MSFRQLKMRGKEVRFSRWTRWEDRSSLDDVSSPGVYLLAHFQDPPAGPASPLDERIVYIGETCSNSLRGRWQQFHRSAFVGKFGHSGGETYRKYRRKSGARTGQLFVAALAVSDISDDLRHLFIRFIERKLIWEFALKWGSAPPCNRK